jgi:hypothetical protein
MMSTTAPKPATTPIPVQLSEPEFEAFILPHLSMPKRGLKCKLGYHRVFNLILWVLYTGMQWKAEWRGLAGGSGGVLTGVAVRLRGETRKGLGLAAPLTPW